MAPEPSLRMRVREALLAKSNWQMNLLALQEGMKSGLSGDHSIADAFTAIAIDELAKAPAEVRAFWDEPCDCGIEHF